MEKNSIPTLSVDGWTSNKNAQMGKLFEYFLASEYSQSNTFYGGISSLKYILANYNESFEISEEIKKSLIKLYENYYDSLDVSVVVDEESSESSIDFAINIIATYEGERFVLAKDIKESNGSVVNFDEILYDIHQTYLEN